MSTPVARSNGLFVLLVAPLWFAFGFLTDLPSNVLDPKHESIASRLAGWTSAMFHVSGATVAALIQPLWGLSWGLVAAVVIARRLAARRGVPLELREIIGGLDQRVAGIGVAAPLMTLVVYNGITDVLAGLAVIVLMGDAARYGLKRGKGARHEAACHASWDAALSTIFGVSVAVVHEQAGLHEDGTTLVVQPVPSAMAARLTDLAALDAGFAVVAPSYMLAEGASNRRIEIVYASPEVEARRRALQSSGGLIAGLGSAPSALPSIPPIPEGWEPTGPLGDVAPVPSATPFKINLEDL